MTQAVAVPTTSKDEGAPTLPQQASTDSLEASAWQADRENATPVLWGEGRG